MSLGLDRFDNTERQPTFNELRCGFCDIHIPNKRNATFKNYSGQYWNVFCDSDCLCDVLIVDPHTEAWKHIYPTLRKNRITNKIVYSLGIKG